MLEAAETQSRDDRRGQKGGRLSWGTVSRPPLTLMRPMHGRVVSMMSNTTCNVPQHVPEELAMSFLEGGISQPVGSSLENTMPEKRIHSVGTTPPSLLSLDGGPSAATARNQQHGNASACPREAAEGRGKKAGSVGFGASGGGSRLRAWMSSSARHAAVRPLKRLCDDPFLLLCPCRE